MEKNRRIIKFRAKDNVDNEWYYGDLLQVIDNDTTERYFIITDNYSSKATNIELNMCQSPEVISETIGQFTGLHDKNGKEIYESDVVEVTREGILERGVVIFGSGCYFIKVKEHFLNGVTLLPLHECSRNDYKLKVIGNIYENSDLLGE